MGQHPILLGGNLSRKVICIVYDSIVLKNAWGQQGSVSDLHYGFDKGGVCT